jgi:hypothetical protein
MSTVLQGGYTLYGWCGAAGVRVLQVLVDFFRPLFPSLYLHRVYKSSCRSPAPSIEANAPKEAVQGPKGGPPYRPTHQVAQKVGGATRGGLQEPKEAEGTIDALSRHARCRASTASRFSQ